MNRNTVSGDIINLSLRQLGATRIRVFDSRMHIVSFDLGDGFIVTYVFNITRKDKYFLQRTRPYSMVKGKYANQQEIVEFIKDDIARFKESKRLNDAGKYIEVEEKLSGIYERMEHIFLHHNVDEKIFDRLKSELDTLAGELEEIHSESEIIKMH
jgi:hypothetical protein